MKIQEELIEQALDKAYKQAGNNAFFGNGFKAGVQFVLNTLPNPIEVIDARINSLKSELTYSGQGFEFYQRLENLIDELEDLKTEFNGN